MLRKPQGSSSIGTVLKIQFQGEHPIEVDMISTCTLRVSVESSNGAPVTRLPPVAVSRSEAEKMQW